MTNVMWNWGTFVFSVAVTFVQAPFVVRTLGNTSYGIWVLVAAMVGYLGLLDFGVRSAVTRYIAKLHAQREDRDASVLLSTALSIFGALGAIAIAVTAVIALVIVARLHLTRAEIHTARVLVALGGLTMASTLVSGAFGGVVIGLQRFDVSGQIEIVVTALRALAIYGVLKAGFGLTGLALTMLAASVIRMAVLAIVARRLYPELRVDRARWDRAWSQRIFAFSLYSTLITFSTTVILYTDSLVIGAFLPAAQITFFSIAASLTDYARTLVRGVSTTMTPRTSAMEGEGTDAMARMVVRVLRFATVLILPVAVTFLIRGASFIRLWMGADYGAPSGVLLRILTLSMVFYAASQVLGASLLGVSSHRVFVPLFVAEAAANVLLSIILVRRMGLPGVAWGTTIPSLVSSMLAFPLIARRVLAIPVWRYYREAWIRPCLGMVPFALASLAVERYWPGDNLAVYFAGVLLVLPLAFFGVWLVALDGAERQDLWARVRGLRRLSAW